MTHDELEKKVLAMEEVVKHHNKKLKHLKLFVWTNFEPDYSGGLAFAIASNEKQARQLIESGRVGKVREWGELEMYPLNEKIAFSVTGSS